MATSNGYNIVFLNGSQELTKVMWGQEARDRLSRYGFEVCLPAQAHDCTLDYPTLLADADAIITTWGSPCLDNSVLQYAPKVKILGHAAGSVGGVVSEDLYERGIKVTCANPVMAEYVAEWALMMTLIAARRLDHYAGLYGKTRMQWEQREQAEGLGEKTVGIWGLGDISKRFMKLLNVIKPKRLLICSNHATLQDLATSGAEAVSLETLLAESDIIHLLAGMTEENRHRVGAPELALIRDGSTLINEGRARLVEPTALYQELQSGRINGIFDVFYSEPVAADDPLLALPNVLLTPHNAAHPGRGSYVPHVLAEIDRFRRGEALQAEVSRSRSATMTQPKLVHV